MSEVVQESEVIASPAGAKRKMDPGFSRNLKIIGGALGLGVLALVLGIAMRPGQQTDQVRTSDIQVGGGNVQAAGQITPAMENMLREQQLAEAAAAANRGLSYIPPDATGRTEAIEPAVQPQLQASSYESVAVAQAGGAVSESDQRRREGLDRQLRAFMTDAERSDVARVRVTAERDEKTEKAAADAAVSSAPSAARNLREIVGGLEIVAGTLAGDLNVPAGRDVFASALVRSGPLNGAFMVGTARVVDESLEINFTQMRVGNKTYVIDAIVLDQATTANAIAGSVDRRILQRYVLPIALATAQGFFTAKAAVGSVAVSIGNDSAVATPASTSEQARSAGIAEGFKIGGQEIQRGAQSPIIVSAPRGTSVGLMFRSPVTEEIK